MADGLTKSMLKHRHNSPTYAMINYSETVNRNIPFKGKVKNAINYWRFYFDSNPKAKPKIGLKWYPFFLFGLYYNYKDHKQIEKTK